MRLVAVVQARVSSSRLPAKVFLDLGGRTALSRCLTRVQRMAGLSEVVVATSDTPADDLVAALCARLGVRFVRGSETDVLSRYALAARATKADAVVRFTSDCPLLDPQVSAHVLRALEENASTLAYVSNTLVRKLPRGLDTEAFTREALEQADREATEPADREHVTRFLYANPARFRTASALPPVGRDLSHHRWTLDTLDDYRFLFQLFERLGARGDDATMEEVLEVVEGDTTLASINAHVQQKPH